MTIFCQSSVNCWGFCWAPNLVVLCFCDGEKGRGWEVPSARMFGSGEGGGDGGSGPVGTGWVCGSGGKGVGGGECWRHLLQAWAPACIALCPSSGPAKPIQLPAMLREGASGRHFWKCMHRRPAFFTTDMNSGNSAMSDMRSC